MTNYFSKETTRLQTNSLKWNVEDHVLPMWVADMDFEVAPAISKALSKRVDHHIFGYNIISNAYFEAYRDWSKRRYHVDYDIETMMFCTGIVPAISSMVRKLSRVGDSVLIQAPVYNIFYNSILNNQRHVLSSDLIYNEGQYSIDFHDLEEKLSRETTTLMILCQPHNPIGKVWDKDTLTRIATLCKQYHVTVISDEIHCDIVTPGLTYVPFHDVARDILEDYVICLSPSKSFNTAGLQMACLIVPNDSLRAKVSRGINTDEVAEGNSFVEVAAIAAYNESEDWLNDLNIYIQDNKDYAYSFIQENIPSLKAIHADATYLLWVDCSQVTDSSDELVSFIKEKTGLMISSGSSYGEISKCFIRINLATTHHRVEDGLNRLKQGIELYQQEK